MSDAKRKQLVEKLTAAYWAEVETVMNYLAASINPDGVRAREIAGSLTADVAEELGHARQFGERIKELGGTVPGSLAFAAEQKSMQPPDDSADVEHVIHGVIEAERSAIEMYTDIISFTDGWDYVTQDMVVTILADEEKHLRLFEGYLREYQSGR